MKKISYIGILVIILLFSCSKEQPLSPVSSSETTNPEMIIIPTLADDINDTSTTSTTGVDDITDPEKEDKEKTNKKAKN